MDPIVAGVVSALGGGLLVKLVEQFFASRTRSQDRELEGESLRIKELREEIALLKAERDKYKESEITWTTKYFDLMASFNELKLKLGPVPDVAPVPQKPDLKDPNMILDMIKQIVGES